MSRNPEIQRYTCIVVIIAHLAITQVINLTLRGNVNHLWNKYLIPGGYHDIVKLSAHRYNFRHKVNYLFEHINLKGIAYLQNSAIKNCTAPSLFHVISLNFEPNRKFTRHGTGADCSILDMAIYSVILARYLFNEYDIYFVKSVILIKHLIGVIYLSYSQPITLPTLCRSTDLSKTKQESSFSQNIVWHSV